MKIFFDCHRSSSLELSHSFAIVRSNQLAYIYLPMLANLRNCGKATVTKQGIYTRYPVSIGEWSTEWQHERSVLLLDRKRWRTPQHSLGSFVGERNPTSSDLNQLLQPRIAIKYERFDLRPRYTARNFLPSLFPRLFPYFPSLSLSLLTPLMQYFSLLIYFPFINTHLFIHTYIHSFIFTILFFTLKLFQG